MAATLAVKSPAIRIAALDMNRATLLPRLPGPVRQAALGPCLFAFPPAAREAAVAPLAWRGLGPALDCMAALPVFRRALAAAAKTGTLVIALRRPDSRAAWLPPSSRSGSTADVPTTSRRLRLLAPTG